MTRPMLKFTLEGNHGTVEIDRATGHPLRGTRYVDGCVVEGIAEEYADMQQFFVDHLPAEVFLGRADILNAGFLDRDGHYFPPDWVYLAPSRTTFEPSGEGWAVVFGPPGFERGRLPTPNELLDIERIVADPRPG